MKKKVDEVLVINQCLTNSQQLPMQSELSTSTQSSKLQINCSSGRTQKKEYQNFSIDNVRMYFFLNITVWLHVFVDL